MADHAGVYNALIRQSQSDRPQPQQQQEQQRQPTLAVVHPHASCVINCPIEDAWKATREWATFAWLPSVDGREVRGNLLEGGGETSVGAVRSLEIGDQVLFEKLVALDDEEHIMKWKLISHPDTTNPFVASFVNYRCTCRLYPITVGSQTFFDWKGEFYTDPQNVTGMQATWERWYITAFQSLQNHVNEERRKTRRATSFARDQWDAPAQQRPQQQQQQQQQQPGFVPTSHGMSQASRPQQQQQQQPSFVPTSHGMSQASRPQQQQQQQPSFVPTSHGMSQASRPQQQQQQPSFVPTSHGMSYANRPVQQQEQQQQQPMDAEVLVPQYPAGSIPSSSDFSEIRTDLRQVDSSSISTVVSPKSSIVDAPQAEGRFGSGGSDYQRRNLSGGSQAGHEGDQPQFESYPSLKRGM